MENTARSGGVHVHWKIDTDSNLHVAVATNATGWVGFGIAEAGGMPGSDIVVFTAADNSLTDMHALAYATPIVDTCQDWDLVNSTVDTDDGILIFEASRAVNTGDLQDREVKDDSDPFTPAHRVIAAWGNSENIFYHGENRTSGFMRFFQSSESVESRKNSTSFIDLVTNFTIPATQTTYEDKCFHAWNTLNPITNATIDAHLTGISFIEDSETTEYVHHMVLFGSEKQTTNCARVTNLLHMWGPGGKGLKMPENAGFRVGNNGYKTFRIQYHYDNPGLISGKVDNSGLRLHYTDNLRQHDAAVFLLADPLVSLESEVATSGNEDAVRWDFSCPSSCLRNRMEPNETITVFKEVLHMHATGTRMVQSHIRDGKVIRENSVDYYDFNQAGGFAVIQKPYTVERGDSFKTSCYYKSSEEVRFGPASSDEMCITFMMYYPAISKFFGVCTANAPTVLWQCNARYCSSEVEESEIGRSFGTPCNATSQNSKSHHSSTASKLLEKVKAIFDDEN